MKKKNVEDKRRRVHRHKLVHEHKLVLVEVKEDKVKCSIDNGYKHADILKGSKVFGCFRKN